MNIEAKSHEQQDMGSGKKLESLPLTEKQQELEPLQTELKDLLANMRYNDLPIKDGYEAVDEDGVSFATSKKETNFTRRVLDVREEKLTTFKQNIERLNQIVDRLEKLSQQSD